MKKNSLGDRMKEYERTSDAKLVRRLPMIVRLDGKAFHSWTKKSGCVRPFDHTFIDMMAGLAQYLCENIGGAELAYGQSDEISILVRDDQNIDTDAWFDKRLQKVVSIVASLAIHLATGGRHDEQPLDVGPEPVPARRAAAQEVGGAAGYVLAERPQLEQPRNGREARLLRLSPRGGRRRSPRPGHADEVSD